MTNKEKKDFYSSNKAIAELEAKLTIAVEALEKIDKEHWKDCGDGCPHSYWANEALARIKS